MFGPGTGAAALAAVETWLFSDQARQIREIADCDIPHGRCHRPGRPVGVTAQRLMLQGRVITRSTCSSVIFRGAPGRGSSVNPSGRSRTNRNRHLRTVSRDTARLAAISVFDRPCAHSNTIRDRNANVCAVVRRRVHPLRT
jgi:hypothetical protein